VEDRISIIEEPSYRERIRVFEDRIHAGRLLAKKLLENRDFFDIVFAVPSGGVPIGFTIAETFNTALDLVLTRKLHLPWDSEVGFGAVAPDGSMVLNEPLVKYLRLKEDTIRECLRIELGEIERRQKVFRNNKPFPDIKDRKVIVVDDGLASGYSMLAATKYLKKSLPKEVVVAVPTGSNSALKLIQPFCDKIYCLNVRSGSFFAVADAYKIWYDLGDDEVLSFLRRIHA